MQDRAGQEASMLRVEGWGEVGAGWVKRVGLIVGYGRVGCSVG